MKKEIIERTNMYISEMIKMSDSKILEMIGKHNSFDKRRYGRPLKRCIRMLRNKLHTEKRLARQKFKQALKIAQSTIAHNGVVKLKYVDDNGAQECTITLKPNSTKDEN